MNNALKTLAVLSFACGSAAADVPPPAKPVASKPSPTKPAACKATGAALFESDHLAEPEAKLATWSMKVYANGAWVRNDIDADGNPKPQTTGCFSKADTDKLKTNLAGAEWKVTTAQVHCMAMSSSYVIYKVNDKPIFTRKLCSGQALDEKSMAKLQAAIAQTENMSPASD